MLSVYTFEQGGLGVTQEVILSSSVVFREAGEIAVLTGKAANSYHSSSFWSEA